MKLQELIVAGLLIIALGFVLSMGSTVTGSLQESLCAGTWGTFSTSGSAHPFGGYTACCTSVNASAATDCDTWEVSYGLNSTEETLKGVDEIASWQDTIALVIVFAVIISLLVGFVFRGAITGKTGV